MKIIHQSKAALLILFLSTMIASCATSEVSTEQASTVPNDRVFAAQMLAGKNGDGNLIVKRDEPRFGLNCDNLLYVDGTKVAEIAPSEKIELRLPLAEHIVSVSTPGCRAETREITVTTNQSDVKTVRVWSDTHGNIQIQPTAF